MSLNRVILTGTVGQYGVNLRYPEQGTPQTSFTLVCEDPSRDGATFKMFIPVLIIGTQAEALAERLEPGDVVLLEGKLAYQAGKTKDSGKLIVTCFNVEVLRPSMAASNSGPELVRRGAGQ